MADGGFLSMIGINSGNYSLIRFNQFLIIID